MMSQLKYEDHNSNKIYEIKAIYKSSIYVKELKSSHLLDFYNLLSLKKYLIDLKASPISI